MKQNELLRSIQVQPQITDENQIELLSPETDSKPRLAKQAIFATIGALVLLLPLLPLWSNSGILGTLLIIFALLVTPGLALDGLLFGGMRRISGSLIGITLATGAAWYAGLSSLLFALGYKLDIAMISTITSLTAIVAVVFMVVTGQAVTRIKPEKSDLKAFVVIIISVLSLLVVAASSWFVSVNSSILQPEGNFTSISLENKNIDLQNPYNVADNENVITVLVDSNNGNGKEITVDFYDEANGKRVSSVVTEMPSFDLAKSKSLNVKIPEFVGCGILSVNYGVSHIDNIAVKSSNEVTCKTVTLVDVFKRFNIDTSGAPTTSLKDLLNYLQKQGAKADLSSLPANYRACIQKTDPDAVSACLDKIES